MFDEQLYRISAEMIESLALMFLVDEDEAEAFDADEGITAEVAFAGPFRGHLLLRVTEDLLPDVTANMLGRPDRQNIPTEQQHDALKELANVICGNILPNLVGSEAVFDVSSPQILDPGAAPADTDGNTVGKTRFFIEGGLIEVSLGVDDPALLLANRVG